jgi:hypothetical protein
MVLGPGVLMSTFFQAYDRTVQRKGPCKGIPFGKHASKTGSLSGPEIGVHQSPSSAHRDVRDCIDDRLEDSFQSPALGWCSVNGRAGNGSSGVLVLWIPGEEAQLLLGMTICRNRRNDPLSGLHFTSSCRPTIRQEQLPQSENLGLPVQE